MTSMLAFVFFLLVIFAMLAGLTAAHVQHVALLRCPNRYWRHRAMIMCDENVRFGLPADYFLPGDTWCSWSDRRKRHAGQRERLAEQGSLVQKFQRDYDAVAPDRSSGLVWMTEETANALAQAAADMTDDQREAQRRSFAYGNCAIDNPNVTRQMVDDVADEMERGA